MNTQNYILGVDGGNSKTDYLLCTTDGSFVDILREPTCSHEHMGYEKMQITMGEHLSKLFGKNNITVKNISAAAFGLAGADLPDQLTELNKRIVNLGFEKYALANDGILGVKAVAEAGICAVNGSGTVVVGIDEKGTVLQVGGIGPLSGDYAGGYHIARQGILAVYSKYFRGGKDTVVAQEMLKLLSAGSPNDLPTAISEYRFDADSAKTMIQLIDKAAASGDAVSAWILESAGANCGEGVAGCIKNLSFENEITIIKAGSIWNKVKYSGLGKSFEDTIRSTVPNKIRIELLQSPPALGAVFWAKEISGTRVDDMYRKTMRDFLSAEKYSELVKE